MQNVLLILYRILTRAMEIPEKKPVFHIWRHCQKISEKYFMVIYVLQLQFGEANSNVIPKVHPPSYSMASTHEYWESESFSEIPLFYKTKTFA